MVKSIKIRFLKLSFIFLLKIFGETVLPIKMDRLFASKAITNFPSGRRLKILASVTEKATGTVHTATDSTAHLLDSPFVISLENIAKYYMPEIPFRVKVSYPFNSVIY